MFLIRIPSSLNVDLPRLQVAMETTQDVVGAAMKVEQCRHQSCQNPELIHLQRNPGWLKRNQRNPDCLCWLYYLFLLFEVIRLNHVDQFAKSWWCNSRHSAAAQTCSPLPALWTLQTFSRPVEALPLALFHFVASCSRSPAGDCSFSSADTVEPTRSRIMRREQNWNWTWENFSPWSPSAPCHGGPEGDLWRCIWHSHPEYLVPEQPGAALPPHLKGPHLPRQCRKKREAHETSTIYTQVFTLYYQIPRLRRAPGCTPTCSLPESPLSADTPLTFLVLESWTLCWAGSA